MFEHFEERIRAVAARRAAWRRDAVMAKLSASLPGGVAVRAVPEGMLLTGRDLRSRAALDPELRAAIGDVA